MTRSPRASPASNRRTSGAPITWEWIFGDLAVGEVAERAVAVDHSGKGGKSRGDAVFPARLIVLRLAPEAAARAAKAQHRRQNRCRSHRPLQPLIPTALAVDRCASVRSRRLRSP